MKIIQNLFIVIISFFIGLSLCEVLLRTAWPQFQILRGSLAAFHEELGYALVPGAQGSVRFFEFGSYNFKINGQGFRDSKVRENAFKILALGDSFTFGAAVDQEYTYPNQLELLLTSESNLIHVDVINGGVPSYNTCRRELFPQAAGPGGPSPARGRRVLPTGPGQETRLKAMWPARGPAAGTHLRPAAIPRAR